MSDAFDLPPQTLEQVNQLAEKSGRAPAEIVKDAVNSYYCSLFGRSKKWGACPFKKKFSDAEAEVVLRQFDAKRFFLEEPFRFTRPGEPEIAVRDEEVTDLASVPGFLTWLVPRYGRHTLPALLHDQLVEDDMDPDDREAADTLFRDAMGSARVPFIRRWTIWAAVSIATVFKRPLAWKLFMGLWLVVFGIAGVELFLRLVLWRDGVLFSLSTLVILLSPIVLSVVWTKRYRLGLLSAYNLFLLPVPIVAVLATLAVYLAAEMGARMYIRARYGFDVPVNPIRLSRL